MNLSKENLVPSPSNDPT